MSRRPAAVVEEAASVRGQQCGGRAVASQSGIRAAAAAMPSTPKRGEAPQLTATLREKGFTGYLHHSDARLHRVPFAFNCRYFLVTPRSSVGQGSVP